MRARVTGMARFLAAKYRQNSNCAVEKSVSTQRLTNRRSPSALAGFLTTEQPSFANQRAAFCSMSALKSPKLRHPPVKVAAATSSEVHSARVVTGCIELVRDIVELPSVSAGSAAVDSWSGDLLVLGIFEEALEVKDDTVSLVCPDLTSMDSKFGGVVKDILAMGDFKGKVGNSATMRVSGAAVKFVQLVGLGPKDKAKPVVNWGVSPYQTLGVSVATGAKAVKAVKAGIAIVAQPETDAATQTDIVAKITVGAMLGGYETAAFKSKAKAAAAASKLQSIELLTVPPEAVSPGAAEGTSLAQAVLLARFLVEAPPNIATPTFLAEQAQLIAELEPEVMTCEILDYEQCRAMNMGCYLGVAEASYPDEPPRFIHLKYSPKGEVHNKVAIIGKGVTFDSGGYNIKAGAGSMIELMKFDMGGAAATLGSAKAVSLLKPQGVEIHFLVPATENQIDGKALRPGDVLTAANGKTVEVANTDAEGRLTLADAMWYAEHKLGVTAIVDVATLTGAAIVSLGTHIAGLFTPNDRMADRLLGAAKATGEKLWRMPFEEAYADQLKSPIADMKNLGSRFGGAITAALFLKEFVSTDKIEWAHMDIAPTAWNFDKSIGTGYGVMLLTKWASEYGAAPSKADS